MKCRKARASLADFKAKCIGPSFAAQRFHTQKKHRFREWRRFMTMGARLTLVFSLLICTASLTFAQNTNSGDIRGTVKDSTGAVLPGVTITVTNLDTAVTKHLVTNDDGLYDTAAILPGKYQVTFARDGFDKLVRGPITVPVGIITVNAELRVGSTSQQVMVTENVPLVQTESPEQSTTFEANTL